jgi:transcription initiation factor TFIID TATA-box-binding protein
MIITNVVCSANFSCSIDLRHLCYRIANARYDPKTFSGLIWQHKTIGGKCLVFANGVINCNRKAPSATEGRQRLRQYERRIQRLGFTVRLKEIKLITISASHTLSNALDLPLLAKERQVVYEPELFSSLNFKREGVHFCCFHSSKVEITGVKNLSQIDDVVYPVLIELELYTRKKE